MINYCPLDIKQANYYRKSLYCWLNVAEGGKRAGKNILNIMAYAETIENHPDKIHLVAGVTKATAEMNIMDSNGFGLEHYFEGRCYRGKYNKVECLFIQSRTGQKVVLVAGGKDSDSYRAIKGFSLGSVYITEANECHHTFVKECMDRTISSRERKIFFDINPKPPKHWFYTDILDYQDLLYKEGKNKLYNYAHFTLWNNQSLSDKTLKTVIATYDKSSLWYQADILGKRTSATGRIYTGYRARKVLKSRKEVADMNFSQLSIGVDVGGTDATVATLNGFTKGYREVCLVDGYYHKQGKESGYDHAKYAKEIVFKVLEWIDIYPILYASPIFVESADKLFRQALANELKRQGLLRITIVPAYKIDGIIDRIRLTNILINQERFFISEHMLPWIEAYENAVWSDEEYEKGEWVRVDDGSYPVDCLDSTEYGIQPFKPQLLRGGAFQ